MKSKLMLASMILLASLSASAQKIYTGSIVFLEKGYKIQVDQPASKADEQKGKEFIKKIAVEAFGQSVLDSKFNNYGEIMLSKTKNIDVESVADISDKDRKLGDYYIGIMSGDNQSARILDEYIINSKTKTLYVTDKGWQDKKKPRKIKI